MLMVQNITKTRRNSATSNNKPKHRINLGLSGPSRFGQQWNLFRVGFTKIEGTYQFSFRKTSSVEFFGREMTGKSTVNQGGSLLNLFNQEEIEQLAESAWLRLWQKFISFGTVSAGVIAVLMILQLLKMFIDAIIRCYTLHSIFGWSVHLLGACFA